MIPTIKTEKSEQTSLLSKHSKDKEDKGDFAELFGLLTQTPKTELPNSKISKVTNKKEAIPSSSTQNVMLQESNLKNTDKKLLKTAQIPNPKNPKELLEFTKAQNIQSSVKTLKDITQIANKLQLNLQKISIIKDEANKEVSIKNIINPQEVQISQKSTKTLPSKQANNLLNMILQDKELLSKTNKKADTTLNHSTKEIKVKSTILDKEILLKSTKNVESNKKVDTTLNPSTKEIKVKSAILDKEILPKSTKNVESNKKVDTTLNPSTKEENDKTTFKANDSKSKGDEIITDSFKIDKADKALDAKESIQKNIFKQENILETKEKIELAQESREKNQIKAQKIVQEEKQSPIVFNKTKKDKFETSFGKQSQKTTQDSSNKYALDEKEIKQNDAQKVNSTSINPSNIEMQKTQNFIDNLLKIEIPQKTKILKYEEFEKETKEKKTEKIHQEIYQNILQNQNNLLLSPRETFLHFSDKLRDALQNYKPPITKISLELNPESLGSVELTITKMGDKINVQISSNQNALQLFMQNMQDFKNQLNNVGFSEVTMDFKDMSGNSFSQNSGGNFSDSRQQNPKQQQKGNENGLQIYQQAEETNREISHLDLSFSYYA
ncbi:MAG: flagellar hook-length control protein FliK [Helicobacter sp.]|uniref:flagellar hook-length control protein FliK n=1 Tax=Helicobacter sp. TaxID=218 RepID=UPI002A911C34|nr:flagellar hook-length control protein FliK [Helicobacter sp.]MDY5616297.1 flagellar hook-length control protein FliK [Helicobacter sp.]